MGGIVFWGTEKLKELSDYYLNKVGCRLWLNQGDCRIFRHGNLTFGFCARKSAETDGILTFFYNSKNDIDRLYDLFKSDAESPPQENKKYNIYHFFTADPEGRRIEFQYFHNPVTQYLSGDRLLLTRRSIRDYEPTEVPENILMEIINNCRYAPTSKNSQSFYYKILRDRNIMNKVAAVRGSSSAPIGRTPMAVAICSDPALSKRHIQDACIGTYHFNLAAWFYGLGTCWIGGMDRDDVKKMINVPAEHYVATVTPLGYPADRSIIPPVRKDMDWFLRD
jgi:nitroreductase